MSNLYWLTKAQMGRLWRYFQKSRGKPSVDDQRLLSGIIFVSPNGLRWCDAPKEHGPHKTLYNRWKRCSDMGVFMWIMEGRAAKAPDNKTISIDATHLKAHRTASSLAIKKGVQTPDWSYQRWDEHEIARCNRHDQAANPVLHDHRSSQRLHCSKSVGEQLATVRLAIGRPGLRCRLVRRGSCRYGNNTLHSETKVTRRGHKVR